MVYTQEKKKEMREKCGLRFTAVKERKERRLRVKLSSKSLHTPVKMNRRKRGYLCAPGVNG